MARPHCLRASKEAAAWQVEVTWPEAAEKNRERERSSKGPLPPPPPLLETEATERVG